MAGFVKLVKIEHHMDEPHPNGIDNGTVISGYAKKEPTVGEIFFITISSRWFRTSIVQEIIDKNTFRTQNSTYHWEYVKS